MLCEPALSPKDPCFHLPLFTCIAQSHVCQGSMSSFLLQIYQGEPLKEKLRQFCQFYLIILILQFPCFLCDYTRWLFNNIYWVFVCLCVLQYNLSSKNNPVKNSQVLAGMGVRVPSQKSQTLKLVRPGSESQPIICRLCHFRLIIKST